jgi:hypothetical protein
VGAGLGLAALPEAAAPLAGPALAMRRLRAPVITRDITAIARPGLEPEGRGALVRALAEGSGGALNLAVENDKTV